jgi:predicted TIM-barrel fold metal-dependent hydrolase
MDSNGVVAEVIFPNTAPPFMPASVLSGTPPTSRQDYERRWAGLKAHNRWLMDFCREAPGQRAGVAQIMTYDVDDAVAEVRAAHAGGLTGGILLPMDPKDAGGLIPYYFPRHDPLWAACEDLDMPVHRHASTSSESTPSDETGLAVLLVGWAERQFYDRRPLGQLILGGIFERYPKLKFVMTECLTGWVPGYLEGLDEMVLALNESKGTLTHLAPAVARLSMRPSEYFARNCFLGASLFLPSEAKRRHEIGLENIMWGVDYPHSEGVFPYTLDALRLTFADVPEPEVRKMLGTTAAGVYGFDLDYLQGLADRVGPTVEDLAQPVVSLPKVPEDTRSPVFGRPDAFEETSK